MKRILRTKKIALIGGDGIGPDLLREARALLEFYRDALQLPLDLWDLDLGADRFLADGTTLPDNVLRVIRDDCAAVMIGALGDLRVPKMEHVRDIGIRLNAACDLYANICPARALADKIVPIKGKTKKDVDFVVIRENSEGMGVGLGGQLRRGSPHEIAITEDVSTRRGVERILRAAFGYARSHKKTRVHMTEKSHVMRQTHELWPRVFREVAKEYPDIEPICVCADSLCRQLVQNPSEFQVIVCNNLFGDIIKEIANALQGGVGMAGSVCVHPSSRPRVALFEPAQGPAPELVGRDSANPFGTILTVGWMLAHMGWPGELERVEKAIAWAIEAGQATPDAGGALGTRAAAAAVRNQISRSFNA